MTEPELMSMVVSRELIDSFEGALFALIDKEAE